MHPYLPYFYPIFLVLLGLFISCKENSVVENIDGYFDDKLEDLEKVPNNKRNPIRFAVTSLIVPSAGIGHFEEMVKYISEQINYPCVLIHEFDRSAVTGMDIFLSIILMGVVTTIYTTIGGFEAVVWSDCIQGILMLFATVLMAVLAIYNLDGGITEFIEVNQSFDKFKIAIFEMDFALPIVLSFLINGILLELAAGSDQAFVQRVLATPKKDIVKLSLFTVAFTVVASVATHLAGLTMFSFFHANPEKLDPLMQNDQIIPIYIVQNVPSGISGLMVAALFAASMSTLSSSINSVSTLLSKDFYERFKPGVSDKKKLIFMKAMSVLIGVFGTSVALYMAKMELRSLWAAFTELMAFLGGGFASIYILGMFSNRANTGGIICGVIISFITIFLTKKYLDLHWLLYVSIPMGSALIGGYVCSFFFSGNGVNLTGLTIYNMNKNKDSDD